MKERDSNNSLIEAGDANDVSQVSSYGRNSTNISFERKELVQKIIGDVVYSRDVYFKDEYQQMRDDMQFAYDGCTPEWKEAGNYTANIVQRHISQKTASLYAKNPRAIARRKEKMDFEIWDEDMQSLMQAFQLVSAGIQDPNSLMLLEDYQRGMANRTMINKIGKTLEIVYRYYQNEQTPTFKTEMKQVVRRVITTGVAYVKSGYQRIDAMSPDTTRKLYDYDRRMKTLQKMIVDQEDEKTEQVSSMVEDIKLIIKDLNEDPEILMREGLTHHFPFSTSIIVDPKCTDLSGFKGADWVAEEYAFSADQIKEIWHIDVCQGGGKSNFRRSETNQFFTGIVDSRGDQIKKPIDNGDEIFRCWEVYNIKTGLVYYVAEGYDDFLEEPHAPYVDTGKFWPYEVLLFNKAENEQCIFPHSDVFYMRDQQMEINRQREGLRKHRIANRPKYIAPRGSLEDEDKDRLENHEDSAVIEINNMKIGQNSADIVQPMKMAGIDPNLYDVSQSYDDLLRVIGAQEANFGGTSNATATEASIGESSRVSSTESNRDDLDMLLGALARSDGSILFAEESEQSVKEIAGPGAVWPVFSREQRAKELYLDIEAGSSGKPNQALEVANFERLAPLLMQIPGVKADRMAKEAVKRLDDRLDLAEFLEPGIPSINAQNAIAGAPSNPQQGGNVNAEGTPNNQQGQQANAQGAGGPGLEQILNQLSAQ